MLHVVCLSSLRLTSDIIVSPEVMSVVVGPGQRGKLVEGTWWPFIVLFH